MPQKKIHDVEVFMISPDGQKLPIRIKELEDLTTLTEVTEKMEEWNFRHVVYCKDCKYLQKWRSEESAKKFGQIYECIRNVFDCPKPEDFCSFAERRTDGSK